jgi:predicted nucleotidyltransferase
MNARDEYIVNLIKERILRKNPDAKIVLFGSHARGEFNDDSDWDILILLNYLNVTREVEKKYREELFDVELEIGQPISTFVFSNQDWESRHSVSPFYQNVKKEGLVLS